MDLINQLEHQAYGTIADHSPAISSAHLSPRSPFENFEFQRASPRIAPNTPSYNGSYQNSPYTTYSEISTNHHNINEPLGLFDNEEEALVFKQGAEDYDPRHYDAPANIRYDAPTHIGSGDGLLFDLNTYISNIDGPNSHIQVAVTPPADQPYESMGAPYDHSSPASSNGGPGPGDSASVRSRASSISSNRIGSPPTSGRGNDQFARQFENLNFHGNNGGNTNAAFSPPNEARSPPRLVIAESSPHVPLFSVPPEINAPEGEGGRIAGGTGLEFRVVPATPVSGGGAAQPAVPSFQAQPGVTPDQSTWHVQATDGAVGVPGGPDGQSSVFTFPPSGPSPPTESPEQLFVPYGHRHQRSKSETALQHPFAGVNQQLWTMPPDYESALDDGSVLDYPTAAATVASSPGASTISFASNDPMQQHTRPAQFNHFSYGPPSSNTVHGGSPHMPVNMALPMASSMSTNQYLSPSDAIQSTQLRRSVSDGGRRGSYHRQSRSEDLNGGMGAPLAFAQEQFLSPTNLVPNIRGHHRRASSGSRSSRGVSAGFMNAQGVLLPSGGPGSYTARTSPYPSPKASPRGLAGPLPNVSMSARRPIQVQGGGYGSPRVSEDMLLVAEGGMVANGKSVQGNIPVQKQNVTTHATKDASEKRRKTDATFMCPVPGCGSTFTRHFNLKGHLRSHNEEKPYQCKWPGCAKSFARQHDCKRHENLHLNIRPFTCEGCKKTFARMDALNRHLRSEGGTECQKVQAEVTNTNGMDEMHPHHQHHPGLAKAEEMTWDMNGFVM